MLENLAAMLEMDGLFGESAWVAQVFVVVLLVLIANMVVRIALKRLATKMKTTDNTWDDALVHAIRGPVPVMVWIVGLSVAAKIAGAQTDATIFEYIDPMRQLGVVACFIWFAIRIVSGVEVNMIRRYEQTGEGLDQSSLHAIGKLVRAAVFITGVLVAMQTLGYSISGLLAVGGIGGIAVGFAARDLLSNLFGGLTVYMDQPFGIGDWVRSPDREIEGTVEDIGWRRTVIRTFDKRPLYVPNSAFLTISVENPSRMQNRRIKETIGVRYDDVESVEKIVSEVREMLTKHEDIDDQQTLIVNFNAFGGSSLDLLVYTFTKTTVWTEYHHIKEAVLLKIYEIIRRHGGDMAFPTRTLHVADAIAIENMASPKAAKDSPAS